MTTPERKPTKIERETRIMKCVELLSYGMRPPAIWQYVTEKTDWEVSIRTVHRYLKSATDILRENSKFDREVEIGKAMERMETLYQRDMAIQDFKAALAVTRSRIDLLGLAAPKIIKAEVSKQQSWADFIATVEAQPGEDGVDENDLVE